MNEAYLRYIHSKIQNGHPDSIHVGHQLHTEDNQHSDRIIIHS